MAVPGDARPRRGSPVRPADRRAAVDVGHPEGAAAPAPPTCSAATLESVTAAAAEAAGAWPGRAGPGQAARVAAITPLAACGSSHVYQFIQNKY